MKNIILFLFILFSTQSFGQIYTFKIARDISTYQKIVRGDTILKTKKINYDSCWIGFSERGVIYIDLFLKDTSYMRVLNRQCLEDNHLIEITINSKKSTFSNIDIIIQFNKKTIEVLHLEKPILQWNIEWVDDYFEYFRDYGYNPQIEEIEKENSWFCGTEGTKFQPLELIPYTN